MSQPVDSGFDARASAVGSGALTIPDEQHRWRCGGCGNMTRFDVIREAKTREFWHLDLAGGPKVEESDIVSQRITAVSCRWCNRDDAIEVIARPGVESG